MSKVEHWKNVCRCVPFIEPGAGVRETQEAIEEMLAEIARLTNKLNADSQNFEIECQKAEIARLAAEVERLRDEADRACKRSQFHKDNHLAAEAEIELLRGEILEACTESFNANVRLSAVTRSYESLGYASYDDWLGHELTKGML